MVKRHAAHDAVASRDADLGHLAVLLFKARDLAHFELHLPVLAELAHARNGACRRAESVAPVQQHNAFSLADEIERPVKSAVSAAADHDVLSGEHLGVAHAVVQLRALELLNAGHAQGAGLERADACGDDDHLAQELRPLVGLDVKAPVFALLHLGHFLAEMELGAERLNLLEKIFRKLVRGVDGHGRDVVNGLGGIELHALAAHVAQGVHHVRLDLQQPQFKNLKEPDGARANDHRIRFNDLIGLGSDSQVIFNSHDKQTKE